MQQIAVRICGFVVKLVRKPLPLIETLISRKASEVSEILRYILELDEKN